MVSKLRIVWKQTVLHKAPLVQWQYTSNSAEYELEDMIGLAGDGGGAYVQWVMGTGEPSCSDIVRVRVDIIGHARNNM